jgi:hypothetical protein
MYNYPTVRTGMTYGRCTIGMVPGTATVRTYEVRLSCPVLRTVRLYVPGTLRLYLLEYPQGNVVQLTLLSVRLSCMTDSLPGTDINVLLRTYYLD